MASIECCLQNAVCHPGDDSLNYDSSGNKCDPGSTYLFSPDCVQTLNSFCLGKDTLDNPYKRLEIVAQRLPICQDYFEKMAYVSPALKCPLLVDHPMDQPYLFSSAGVSSVSGMFEDLLHFAETTGSGKGFYSPLNNNDFYQYAYQICLNNPSFCHSYLEKYCQKIDPKELKYFPNLNNWCGCHLRSDYYQEYKDNLQINPECTPFCRPDSVIKNVAADRITPVVCKQNICLIDDITIDLVKTSVGGKIQFNQICSGCSAGSCQCVMSNNSIGSINSKIVGNIDFEQQCGQQKFMVSNPNPNQYPQYIPSPNQNRKIDLKEFVSYNDQGEKLYFGLSKKTFVSIIILLFTLAILIYVIVFM